jgi:hypothetical protein
VRLEREVMAGPRRYRYGSSPKGGLSPAAFGLVVAGRDHEAGELRLRSREARFRLGRYLDAVSRALGVDEAGRDWLDPERDPRCTVAEAVRAGLPVRLAAPCIMLNCCNNLLGYIDARGLPILFHRSAAGRLTCIRQMGPCPTLAEVGEALGVTRQRVRQMEEVGLLRARVRASRSGAGLLVAE